MNVSSLRVNNETEMLAFGAQLASALGGRGSVHLTGQLGAGKTTLSRGLLRGMGYEGAVKSPTFTLVEPYNLHGKEIFHFDLYRLADPSELDYIGIDDYFGADNLCLIEWPERAEGNLPEHDLDIVIDVLAETRNIGVTANTSHGQDVCRQLFG